MPYPDDMPARSGPLAPPSRLPADLAARVSALQGTCDTARALEARVVEMHAEDEDVFADLLGSIEIAIADAQSRIRRIEYDNAR